MPIAPIVPVFLGWHMSAVRRDQPHYYTAALQQQHQRNQRVPGIIAPSPTEWQKNATRLKRSPAAPDLGGGEHASAAAHVTESTLTGTLGSATLDTRDTRHSAPGTPRLGRGLRDRAGQDRTGHGATYRGGGGYDGTYNKKKQKMTRWLEDWRTTCLCYCILVRRGKRTGRTRQRKRAAQPKGRQDKDADGPTRRISDTCYQEWPTQVQAPTYTRAHTSIWGEWHGFVLRELYMEGFFLFT